MTDETENLEATEADATDEAQDADEQDTFSREYVEKLRAEAAEHRVKAKEAQDALSASVTAYRSLAVEHAAQDILKAPAALEWRDEWATDEGLDFEAIRTAATEYANQFPHAAKVSGDVGQGYKDSASTVVDLAGMLRAGS
ncbi:hypothetical protein H7F30_11055 [Dermacoccus sp. PAMC28757]|uniref:hypothetical protein n=1 Tax=Dermacoccus sp. PAMC28757 TaxID=2762331 RepID=UPI00164E32B4|nr:hypothetical protein [Dermacoccus sp. PAMC28757]QNK52160.1 hypothetical protein H7F30_11055 [Dermacoccus sp. PAMC28757]